MPIQTAHTPSASTMDYVPVAFVEALCATLKKKDLENVQELGGPWSSTTATHYKRRREFTVDLKLCPDGTQVGIEVNLVGSRHFTRLASLSKYDRIRTIRPGDFCFNYLPDKISMERFRTEVLPLFNSLADAYDFHTSAPHTDFYDTYFKLPLADSLFSNLRAPARSIKIGYRGGKSFEFLERQIALGQLEQLKLLGQQWPESMKSTLKSFLRSPNFMKLDLRATNLTIDLDMLIIMVERFRSGDLREKIDLYGKPSKEIEEIGGLLRPRDAVPKLVVTSSLPEPTRTVGGREFEMIWTAPGPRTLHATRSVYNYVHIFICPLGRLGLRHEHYIRCAEAMEIGFEESQAELSSGNLGTMPIALVPRHRIEARRVILSPPSAMPHESIQTARTPSASTMNSVPVAFVDALCATLNKKDLLELLQIGRPCSRTAYAYYKRRREFTVHLKLSPDGTQVGIGLKMTGSMDFMRLASLSKYDRIGAIQLGDFRFDDLPDKIPMERFGTRVLPVLNSRTGTYDFYISASDDSDKNLPTLTNLCGPARTIRIGHTGVKCAEFIQRQIALGRLEELTLRGQEWPESLEASFKSFLRSSNFEILDLRATNLTIDLGMLIIIVTRFLRGDLRKNIILVGKTSEGEMKEIRGVLRLRDAASQLKGLPKPTRTVEGPQMIWTASCPRILHDKWSRFNFVHIFTSFPSPCLIKHVYRTMLTATTEKELEAHLLGTCLYLKDSVIRRTP
uniref:P-loop containing nucleoside triphosphate hydrolase protein n=1 Tax=Steinernema glaseri TaxID=37863 RepID=A0A1I8AQW3_9BILA